MNHAQHELSRCGLLIIGHGTRDDRGRAEFHRVVRDVAGQLAPMPVQPCFLELSSPSITEAAMQLAERGVRRIKAVPLMLLAAGHVRRDIPAALAEAGDVLATDYSGMALKLADHLGAHPSLLQLSRKRYQKALDQAAARQSNSMASMAEGCDALLLMVGRGSSDSDAIEQMLQFARLRAEPTKVGQVETCFMAMAQPSLDSMLARLQNSRWKRIVVQPHLLFHGRLLSRLRQRIDEQALRFPERQWLLTGHLGPDCLLVNAIVDRFVGTAG